MKELSVEQKAKRYNEVLAMAKECITYIPDEAVNKYMLNMFPELKESDGERIRKQIISFLKEFEGDHYRCLDFSSWIDWLEKQGERIDIANKEYWRGYREGKKEILDKYTELEKQGEQKSIDKVEPKFKIGDWIIYNRNDHLREVIQIYDIRDNRYYFNDNIHFSWSVKECDEKSHLWTIEDAKDGDVLVASDDSVFIFARVDGYGCIHHIALANDGVLKINPRLISAWESVRGVKPATKEERDLLFTKMKEETTKETIKL